MSNVEPKKCAQCGAPIDAMATVCKFCGAEVAAQPQYQAPQGQQSAQYAQPQVPPAYVQFNEADRKSKLVAGLLGIFLGAFGVHNFYLGFTSREVIQIVVTFVTCGIGGLWGFIEGILILASNNKVDAKGIPLKN